MIKQIQVLPFKAKMADQELTMALWKAKTNICDHYDPQQVTQFDGVGECDPSGFFYGTDHKDDPMFCARHFYQLEVNGDGIKSSRLTN